MYQALYKWICLLTDKCCLLKITALFYYIFKNLFGVFHNQKALKKVLNTNVNEISSAGLDLIKDFLFHFPLKQHPIVGHFTELNVISVEINMALISALSDTCTPHISCLGSYKHQKSLQSFSMVQEFVDS